MRDIRGPAPFQFGRLAKYPNEKSQEVQYAKNKEFDFKIEKMNQEGRQNAADSLKINFFEDADRKSRNNRVKKTVDEIMNQRNFLLNERRARLKKMLDNEQRSYEKEILNSAVSPLERAAELREKAKQIRLRKENEDMQFVQEKLDQKWRLESDELRTYQSKHMQAGMGIEHMRQVKEKIVRERERLEDEGVFAEMWYQDIQAKNQKEDEKQRVAKERNMEVSMVLKQQMQVLEQQKQEEKRIRLENAKLLKEKSNIEELEKTLNFRKKREEQAMRRHELDLCVRAKLINEKRRLQEEHAFDLKCLEESLVSFQNEDEERSQRKHQLMIEQAHYRKYLQELHEEEKRREKELEAIIEEDTEREFQKQLNKWKAIKSERKKLLEKTLAERRIQIQEKVARNQQKQIVLEQERIQMNKEIEFHKQREIDEWVQSREKIAQYSEDLVDQMHYNDNQKRLIEASKPEEYRQYLKNEDEYERKLNDAMTNLKFVKGKHI